MELPRLKLPHQVERLLEDIWDRWGSEEAKGDEAEIYAWLESREFKAFCAGHSTGAGIQLTDKTLKNLFQEYRLSREYHESE